MKCFFIHKKLVYVFKKQLPPPLFYILSSSLLVKFDLFKILLLIFIFVFIIYIFFIIGYSGGVGIDVLLDNTSFLSF